MPASTAESGTPDLRDTAEELYTEVGDIATTLVKAKFQRVRAKL